MGVSLEIYRAAIGLFNADKILKLKFAYNFNLYCAFVFGMFVFCILFSFLKLILSNDIEMNPGPISSRLFNVGQLNVRSLLAGNKLDEIYFLLKEHNFSIFGMTETWFNDSISNENLSIEGYNTIFRLDRRGRIGGGVAFYINNSILAKQRTDLLIPGFECLWIEFKLKQFDFICGVL